jgi:hypothetical protein
MIIFKKILFNFKKVINSLNLKIYKILKLTKNFHKSINKMIKMIMLNKDNKISNNPIIHVTSHKNP